jgi:hypothetical protein
MDMITPAKAEADYGVVFRPDGTIDATATERRRRALRAATPGLPEGAAMFTFCAERSAQNAVWPEFIRRALATRALDFELQFRTRLVDMVHRTMMDRGLQVTPEMLVDALGREADALGARRV